MGTPIKGSTFLDPPGGLGLLEDSILENPKGSAKSLLRGLPLGSVFHARTIEDLWSGPSHLFPIWEFPKIGDPKIVP